MVDDPLGKYLDVVSCNEYIGWYDGTPEKIDTITWQTAYEKPFVLSEFGADAQAGRHGDAVTRFTEEIQADVYRRQVAMFKRIPFLTGTIAWVLVDFRSPRRPLPAFRTSTIARASSPIAENANRHSTFCAITISPCRIFESPLCR